MRSNAQNSTQAEKYYYKVNEIVLCKNTQIRLDLDRQKFTERLSHMASLL